jgi:hypothetical protein
MAPRESIRTRTKLKDAVDADESEPAASQQTKPETGQFRLQVDRQTKSSYATYAAAEAAGLVIKKGHPVVRVTVYDTVAGSSTLIDLPAQTPDA